MSKRLHPIEKMHAAMSRTFRWKDQQRIAARHVKPLLDALALEHKGWPEAHFGLRCKTCDLLAAWKEPLK